MSTGRFVILAGIAVGVGALLLALGGVLDSVVLEVAGAACILVVFVLRDLWLYAGRSRQLLLGGALLAGVVVVSFVVQRLS